MNDSRKRQQDWEARYHDGRTGWDRGESSPALARWLVEQPFPRDRVLVPGCGHGHEVAALVRHGCAVTAVDIAAQPVLSLSGQLAEQGLHARVLQADLLQWQPAEPFAAIYEQTCLCALDPSTWPAYAARLADWLPSGGRLYALFMQTGRDGGPPFDCPERTMRELFHQGAWDWPAAAPMVVPHPNGLHELGFVLVRR